MSRNNDIDWEKIERLYRLGQLSVREIARQCDTQASTITRRAKKDSWTQDLSALVKQRADATLLSNSDATPLTRADIDVAVATVVQVVREHRKDIGTGRHLVSMLMGQLLEVAAVRPELEATVTEVTAEDKTTQRRTQLMKAIALPTHAGVIRDLSAALKNLLPLERQAFSIGPEEKPPEPPATAAQVTNEFASLREKFNKAKEREHGAQPA